MVVGFNHNFSYKGAVYHIQTEDNGIKSLTIVTLLYRGGTILASRKTSYADISRVDNLELVIEELMKEQHKGMLRSLKNGEFDEAIDRFEKIASGESPVAAAGKPGSSATAVALPEASVAAAQAPPRPVAVPPAPQAESAGTASTKNPARTEASLDEIILTYLVGEDK